MLFMYGYISAVTAFILVCSIRIYRRYITLNPQQKIEKTSYIKREVKEIKKEIKRLQIENKTIRDTSYDKVLGKLKEVSQDGEVYYFSVNDIEQIINELKS